MTSRALLRLLAAAAGLLGLWLIITLVGRSDGRPAGAGPDDWGAFFGALVPESVTVVRIESPGGTRVITREGAGWAIDGFAADSGTVARFWEALSGPASPELVARNPENHQALGLESESATRFVFVTGADSLRLLVGDAGPGRGTSYIRLPGSDAAYLARRDLGAYAERSVDDWRDRRVVVVDTASVSRIEVTREDGGYVLSRSDSVWTVTGDGIDTAGSTPADSGRVSSLLAGLAGIPAVGFVREDEAPPDRAPNASVSAFSSRGDILARIEMGRLDADWWATPSDSGTVYRIPAFRVEQLAPPPELVRSAP